MISRKHNTRKTEYYFAVTETGEQPMEKRRLYCHGENGVRYEMDRNRHGVLLSCHYPNKSGGHNSITFEIYPGEVYQFREDGRLSLLGKHSAERLNMCRCFVNSRDDYIREFGARSVHVFQQNRLRPGHGATLAKDPVFQRVGLRRVEDPAPFPTWYDQSHARGNPTVKTKNPEFILEGQSLD